MSSVTGGSGAIHVYTGFWTNWSYGQLGGGTLTLTKANGGLLIAFIAIYVGATGKSFWRLACFALHRHLSSPTPQDAIYHQRQAILRNVTTAQDAARILGNAIWMWRGKTRRLYGRLLPIVLLALIISISFGVAGVFSSSITRDGANEVLIQGDNCGPLDSKDEIEPIKYTMLFDPFQSSRATTYAHYALRCYTNTSTSDDCNLYIKPQLPSIVDRNASCPFSPEMCKSQNGNIMIDSGYLNSHDDLGVNTAPDSRFLFRMYHQCAPIVTDGYHNITNTSTGPVARYYYGNLARGLANYTYQMPLNYSVSNTEAYTFRGSAHVDYNLGGLKKYTGLPKMSAANSDFLPIPALDRNDADVMLFFLSSQGITFKTQTDDPWFSAHRPGPLRHNAVNDVYTPSYLADELVSVLGCTMAMQICTIDKKCNPLHGYADFSFPRYDLWEDVGMKEFVHWIDHALGLGLFTISGILEALGTSALTARYMLENAGQGPLPIDQWQREVEFWHSASMTSLQGSLTDTANGATEVMMPFKLAPNGTEEWHACRNQKIISTRYTSFSVLGVALILIIGGIIMILDLGLEPMLSFVESRRTKGKPDPERAFARLEWRANATLQLQRMAHEQAGGGTWSNAAGANPVTLSNETLAVLDVTNEGHPLLRSPTDKTFKSQSDLGKELSLDSKMMGEKE